MENREALAYASRAAQRASQAQTWLAGNGGAIDTATGQAGHGLVLLAQALGDLSVAVGLIAKAQET